MSRAVATTRCSAAFTLVEVMVVISVIALLVAILLPALGNARQAAFRTQCSSNIHQQLLAVHTYVAEYHDQLPVMRNYSWQSWSTIISNAGYMQDVLIPYVGGTTGSGGFSNVFRCPAVRSGQSQAWLQAADQCHYRYNVDKAMDHVNNRARLLGDVAKPISAALIYDVAWPDWQRSDFPHIRAASGINVGYVAGQAAPMTAEEYVRLSPNASFEATNPFITEGWPP